MLVALHSCSADSVDVTKGFVVLLTVGSCANTNRPCDCLCHRRYCCACRFVVVVDVCSAAAAAFGFVPIVVSILCLLLLLCFLFTPFPLVCHSDRKFTTAETVDFSKCLPSTACVVHLMVI